MDFQQHKEGSYGREMLLPLPIVENLEWKTYECWAIIMLKGEGVRAMQWNALKCIKTGTGEVILKDSEKFKCNIDADLKIKHGKNRKTTQLSILRDG